MKILYLHQYYKTPEEGGAIRSFHIAKAMSENGHHVDVITSSNDKKAKFVDGKIVVHYFKIGYSNSYGFIRRIFAFLLFIISFILCKISLLLIGLISSLIFLFIIPFKLLIL